MKREYKKLCEEKRRGEREMGEGNRGDENGEAGIESGGREREKRKMMEQGIEMEVWEKYIKELVGEVEWRMRREEGKRKREEDGKREIIERNWTEC